MKIAIAMAHGHAAKWLQICLTSLQMIKNDVEADIYIAATWPDHPTLRIITETDLGRNIKIIPCTIRLHSHATGLDQILDYISDKNYDYMFTMETDCIAVKDNWLDWYLSFMENESIGMAGFFWAEGTNHFNINPSGTIYRMDMLLKYHKEVRENNENMFWHPNGNKHGNDGGMDPSIKDVAGVFSETRGIKNPTPQQINVILKGVPQAAWYEPGAWLYCRSVGEYGGVSVPFDHIYRMYGRHRAPEATYYGTKADIKFIHFWGGTRCYDFLKHEVNDRFVSECAPLWMEREHDLWKEYVPEEYKRIIPSIYEEMNFEEKAKQNLPGWEKIAEIFGENWGKGI